MKFWKKKKEQVELAVDEAATVATDLVEKTALFGPGGVILLLGAAAVGAAATYYVAKKRQTAKEQKKKP